MRINHNITAMNTYRQLTGNNNATAKSLEKLSSGYRINRAGDDAAGLAISEKMRSQIRGLDQASRNAQDGISLIQTTEGAMNEVHSILQRMRELAVQSANGTATDADRSELQKEVTQLKSEIDRIAHDTEFNTKKLLNGDYGYDVANTSNAAKLNGLRVTDSKYDTGDYTVTIANKSVVVDPSYKSTSGIDIGDIGIGTTADGLKAGNYVLQVGGTDVAATFTLKDESGNILGTVSGDNSAAGADLSIQINGVNAITITKGNYNGNAASIDLKIDISADVTISGGNASSVTHTGVVADGNSWMSVEGFEFQVAADITNGTRIDTISNNGLNFHIGANEGQTTRLTLNQVDTVALNIVDVDISTATSAESAIDSLDFAISRVSTERSKLGAVQNRLEHTINNLDTASENLSASESRIRDVDMAKEMMEYTKDNILTQAAQAMLAQANQQPQGVLQLLR